MPADLLLIVEGRSDEAVLRTIIGKRARDLGIRSGISLEFYRRQGKVCTEGIEIAAMERNKFCKVILLWDHAECYKYKNKPSHIAQGFVQAELYKRMLKNCSKAIAIDPQLEIWLCNDWNAIASVLGVSIIQIQQWLGNWGGNVNNSPKEALKYLCKQAGRKCDSALYGEIAAQANLNLWQSCSSFRSLCRQLRRWFP